MSGLHPKMFVAQTTLECWVDSGRVDLRGNEMHFAQPTAAYGIVPAVRFIRVVAGGEGTTLVGKVLAQSRIHELHGELLGDSVVFGESAFEVVPGFIATEVGA